MQPDLELVTVNEGPGGLATFAMVATVGMAAVALIALLVMKQAEKVARAKTSEAWARAAQLDAQANMIDARTAQIGMVADAALPYLFGLFAVLVFAVVLVGAWIYFDHRASERHAREMAFRQSQLNMGHQVDVIGAEYGYMDGLRQDDSGTIPRRSVAEARLVRVSKHSSRYYPPSEL